MAKPEKSIPVLMREPVNDEATRLYAAWEDFRPQQTYDQIKMALGIVYPEVEVTTTKLFALDQLAVVGSKWSLVDSLGRLYALVAIDSVTQETLQASVDALKLERVGLAQLNPRIYVLRSKELDMVLFGGIDVAYSGKTPLQDCLAVIALARI